jgi:hypothetical protein
VLFVFFVVASPLLARRFRLHTAQRNEQLRCVGQSLCL